MEIDLPKDYRFPKLVLYWYQVVLACTVGWDLRIGKMQKSKRKILYDKALD